MQTHDDRDFRVSDFSRPTRKLDPGRLKERAVQMVASGASVITAGLPGEPTLAEWQAANGMHVVRRPDDEQGICRISIGGNIQPDDVQYLVFRGDPIQCAFLLEMAAAALRAGER